MNSGCCLVSTLWSRFVVSSWRGILQRRGVGVLHNLITISATNFPIDCCGRDVATVSFLQTAIPTDCRLHELGQLDVPIIECLCQRYLQTITENSL